MTVFLLAVFALLGYGVLCLVSPTPKCPPVQVTKRKGKRPRTRQCPKCKGKGFRQRPGARLVHRLFWSVAGDRLRDHLKDRVPMRPEDGE